MTTAIFGLVGVIVGAVVTGAVDLYMEHRRTQAAIFKAKRLVGEDLQTIWIHLDNLIDNGITPLGGEDRRARFMPTVAWEAHKETLALKRVLSNDEWGALAAVLHAVASMRLMILEDAPRTPLSSERLEALAEQKALVGDAYKSLTGEAIPLEPGAGRR